MDSIHNCNVCGKPIPPERVEAIPDTLTCVDCSTVQKYKGFLVFGHKTGGETVLINPSDKEALRQAKRFNRRAR